MNNQQQEIEELAKAFQLLRGKEALHLIVEPDACFMLIAQLQLALRHTANRGPVADTIRQFAVDLQRRLVELVPQVEPALEKGWHPEFDQSPITNHQSLTSELATPDPAWGYAVLWTYLGSIKKELDSVIGCVQQAEEASPELDKKVLVKLQWLQAYTKSAIALLPPVDEAN